MGIIIHVPQFTYAIIKPDTKDEIQGLYTDGVTTCLAIAATATPDCVDEITPKSCHHILYHMDAQAKDSLEEVILDWKKSLPNGFKITIYTDEEDVLGEYSEIIEKLKLNPKEFKITHITTNDQCVERDTKDIVSLRERTGQTHEPTKSTNIGTMYFRKYLNDMRTSDSEFEQPIKPILCHDGNNYLTVNEILDQRPDIKTYMEIRDLEKILEETAEIIAKTLAGKIETEEEQIHRYDSLDLLLADSAKRINEKRYYIQESEGVKWEGTDSFVVTEESVRACFSKHFSSAPILSSIFKERDATLEERGGAQSIIKTEIEQIRQEARAAESGESADSTIDNPASYHN